MRPVLGSSKRLLGLDVGRRRIGMALSMPEGGMAYPVKHLVRSSLDRDISALVELARSEGVQGIVVGLPLSLNGQMGPQGKEVMAFVDKLRAQSPVPVEVWDERFTTSEAHRRLAESGRDVRASKGLVDSSAAVLILQAYLDHLRLTSQGEASDSR